MISILVVNYRKSDLTVNLCRSLIALPGKKRLQLVIVDNGTTLESQKVLEPLKAIDEFKVHLLFENENWGYFGGARRGLSFIRAQDAEPSDWTIISNSDITFSDPSFLSRLEELSQSENFGVVAPRIISGLSGKSQNPYMLQRPADSRMHFYKRVFAHPVSCFFYQMLGYVKARAKNIVAGDPPADMVARDIYGAHGSFMIFSRGYFERGGDFSHGPFLFGEEITIAETCLRLGLKIRYIPELAVEHVEHATMGWLPSAQILQFQREASAFCYDSYFSKSERM